LAQKKFTVALGGGGARGFAHIGVFCAMDGNKIQPDLIIGTSMGAMIGALYAHFGTAAKVFDHFEEYINSGKYNSGAYSRLIQIDMEGTDSFFPNLKKFLIKGVTYGKTLLRQSIISYEEYEKSVEALIPNIRIEDLQIPFACVALDLQSGHEVLINRGNLRRAVMASCAIPGVYEPVTEGEMLLADGGWIDRTPVPAARHLGADGILAVDVSKELRPRRDLNMAISIILRSNVITNDRLDLLQRRDADLCLKPEVSDIHVMDFNQFDDIVQRGYQAAKKSMSDIRRLATGRPWYRSMILPLWRQKKPERPLSFEIITMSDGLTETAMTESDDANKE